MACRYFYLRPPPPHRHQVPTVLSTISTHDGNLGVVEAGLACLHQLAVHSDGLGALKGCAPSLTPIITAHAESPVVAEHGYVGLSCVCCSTARRLHWCLWGGYHARCGVFPALCDLSCCCLCTRVKEGHTEAVVSVSG